MNIIQNNPFPIKMKFSFVLGYEIKVTDKNDNLIFFVKQKALKLREHIEIFSNKDKASKLFDITTNKILDFSANYQITDANNQKIGFLRRKGWASIWSASYEVYSNDEHLLYSIKEGNPFVKIADAFLSEIQLLGLFTGYFFNPQYNLSNTNGQKIYTLSKIPSFFSREFALTDQTPNVAEHPDLSVISCMMLLILERRRG